MVRACFLISGVYMGPKYKLGGFTGVKGARNPFDTDYDKFIEWVFYQKGLSCKDKTGRTFWYNEKWKDKCPY